MLIIKKQGLKALLSDTYDVKKIKSSVLSE